MSVKERDAVILKNQDDFDCSDYKSSIKIRCKQKGLFIRLFIYLFIRLLLHLIILCLLILCLLVCFIACRLSGK